MTPRKPSPINPPHPSHVANLRRIRQLAIYLTMQLVYLVQSIGLESIPSWDLYPEAAILWQWFSLLI